MQTKSLLKPIISALPVVILIALLAGISGAEQPTDSSEETSANQTDIAKPSKLQRLGSPRSRAPDGWTRFDWPEKKAVLFGMYAPTEEETKLITAALPTEPIVATKVEKRKVLVFYQCTYPHASIATGNVAFEQLGQSTGAYQATLTDNPEDIRLANLNQYDAVLLNNTTNFEKTIGEQGRADLLAYVRSGKGLIGIHAAADSCKGWREGSKLINGIFSCHPWLPKGTWAFQVHSPAHPINHAIGGEGFWMRDEVYVYRDGSHSAKDSRVLVSLDMSKRHNLESSDLNRKEMQHVVDSIPRPVAWIHDFGKGRVFYSNLGHNNTTYWQPLALKHYLAGIQFALGDLPADTTVTDELAIVDTVGAPELP